MISALDLKKLKNSEFIQFSRNFVKLVETNNPGKLSVTVQYNDMLAKITEMENLFKISTQSAITAEVEQADFRRDQAISGLITTINGFTYHYDDSWVSAAKVLQNNLKVYGAGIARENYQSETAILTNIVNDWESKPELSSALETLNLSGWLEELKNANILFNDHYLVRTKEYANVSPDTLKDKRAETVHTYYELRKFLDAFSVIQPTTHYQQTIKELNVLIEQYNTLLAGRSVTEDTSEKTTRNHLGKKGRVIPTIIQQIRIKVLSVIFIGGLTVKQEINPVRCQAAFLFPRCRMGSL